MKAGAVRQQRQGPRCGVSDGHAARQTARMRRSASCWGVACTPHRHGMVGSCSRRPDDDAKAVSQTGSVQYPGEQEVAQAGQALTPATRPNA
jgi:hypothetical protein